jgi:hypothetical protein
MVSKELARLGQWVCVRGEVGKLSAITEAIAAVRLDDGKYVLAKWEDVEYA